MKKMLFVFILALSFVFPVSASADDPTPILYSVSPTSGDIDGGNTVTVNGADFTSSTVIKVGGTVVSKTFISSTQIDIVMPPKPVGRVSVAAFAGMVGAVLPNAYEYIDIPDPTPTPTPTLSAEPTPTPTASATPTPSATPSVTPSATSSASPTPTPSAAVPVAVSSGGGSSVVEPVSAAVVVEPTLNPVETITLPSSPSYPVYRYANNVTVFTGENAMNVNVSNLFTKRMRFTLQKRIDGAWKTIAIAYRNNLGELVFYGVPQEIGSYRIVNAAKPIKWFSFLRRIDNGMVYKNSSTF